MNYIVICLVCFALFVDAEKWYGRPNPHKKPEFARYMIRNGDWGTLATSSRIYEQPFGDLVSFADGPVESNKGTPYFFISSMSTTWKNIQHNSTVSLTVSEAQSDYCEIKGVDPMEPTCARITLTGEVEQVSNKKELAFAKLTMFSRHPAMKDWPIGHGWHFMALRLSSVNLLSWYGGMSHIKLDDYFNAKDFARKGFPSKSLHPFKAKWTGRPNPHKKSIFARYMIRNGDWGTLATSSGIYKQAFGDLVSFADGPVGSNKGAPYFFISSMSTTWKNIQHNNTVSLTVSEAQSDYCETRGIDPMEPTCARITLTGQVEQVSDEKELVFAKKTKFTRHPAMKDWPIGHGWHFMALRVSSVNLLSWYGGMSHIKLDDYFNIE